MCPPTLGALVIRVRGEQLQVLNRVIQTVPVSVMHYFAREEIASNMLFHHQPMLTNIALTVCMRVILRPYQEIFAALV